MGWIKLIEPLYTRLMQSSSGKDVAKRVHAKAKPTYHPATVAVIDRIVPEIDDVKRVDEGDAWRDRPQAGRG